MGLGLQMPLGLDDDAVGLKQPPLVKGKGGVVAVAPPSSSKGAPHRRTDTPSLWGSTGR